MKTANRRTGAAGAPAERRIVTITGEETDLEELLAECGSALGHAPYLAPGKTEEVPDSYMAGTLRGDVARRRKVDGGPLRIGRTGDSGCDFVRRLTLEDAGSLRADAPSHPLPVAAELVGGGDGSLPLPHVSRFSFPSRTHLHTPLSCGASRARGNRPGFAFRL